MQLWRLTSSKLAELMSQFKSEGQQAVEPERANDPVPKCYTGEFALIQGTVSL